MNDRKPWLEMVETSWALLVNKRAISDVEIQFVAVHRREEFTMDMLIEGKILFSLAPGFMKGREDG